MLQHLLIKDLAIVTYADITFNQGMTVITGETGAGKSILLDALNLALGERSDSHLIRSQADKAEICATFDISSLPGAVLWLAGLELTADDSPHLCIIRRILFANGRSRAFINGRPATTQQLRLLGVYLVQIHGQHQHQQLLKPSEQLKILDAFGQHDDKVSQVKTAYKTWDKLQQQLLSLKNNRVDHQLDLLQYQIAEIEALSLGENELTALYQEHDKLAHAHSTIQACDQTLQLLDHQDEEGASRLLILAEQLLRPLKEKYKTLSNAYECLSTASIQCQEAISEINNFRLRLEVNPARLAEIEHRITQIHDMARKHKVDPLQLLPHYQQLKAQTAIFQNHEKLMQQLAQDIECAHNHYFHFANILTLARKATAEQLAQAVSQCIQQLGMNGAVLTVNLVPVADEGLHLNGNETVYFGISANPGHPTQPLSKVASGGELSRISLALELITAKFLATPCLIFDEVDVGISGKTGAIVGKAVYHLSRCAQVICITHLPQVAAFGDHHIQVTKTRLENNTLTEIHLLNKPARIEEIARMLGGLDVTAQARAHAKQLLKHQEESPMSADA